MAEGDFVEAEKCFDKIDVNRLSYDYQEEYVISRTILLFNKKEFAKAEEELLKIDVKRSANSVPVLFHLACANYAQADYSQAEEQFFACKDNKTYGESAKYYLTNINFVNKNYSDALAMGEEMLGNPKVSECYIYPLKKICGECAFALGNTDSAIKYLQEYTENSNNDNRSIYLLGVSFYNTQQYADAIKTLAMLTDESNEFYQSAYLYLGHSYLKLNDKNGAMFAYEKAMVDDADLQAKESAMFNYCLLTEESNILPFDKKVEIYENYINLFSGNSNTETINQLLAASYYTTKNYKAALESVNKVKNPGKELLKAKQVILYNLATLEFEKKEYSKAKDLFSQTINVGDYNIGVDAKFARLTRFLPQGWVNNLVKFALKMRLKKK